MNIKNPTLTNKTAKTWQNKHYQKIKPNKKQTTTVNYHPNKYQQQDRELPVLCFTNEVLLNILVSKHLRVYYFAFNAKKNKNK